MKEDRQGGKKEEWTIKREVRKMKYGCQLLKIFKINYNQINHVCVYKSNGKISM